MEETERAETQELLNVRAQSVFSFCSKLSVPHTKLSIASEDLKYSAYRPLLWCFL